MFEYNLTLWETVRHATAVKDIAAAADGVDGGDDAELNDARWVILNDRRHYTIQPLPATDAKHKQCTCQAVSGGDSWEGGSFVLQPLSALSSLMRPTSSL